VTFLYESGATLRYVYFPTTSIISLLYAMEDGASAEIAIVGNEGVLGISLFMGGDTTPGAWKHCLVSATKWSRQSLTDSYPTSLHNSTNFI
jgi:hypothetical protein